ncbi:MAG: hypothetical protein IT432_12870 [Phycisphaerales bacterium]|nr:hypothetical protein [Phycisphaerales bacterium]
MNPTLARTYASKSVLLATAAGAIWYFAVRPMTDELRQARAAFDAFAVEIDEHSRQFGAASFDAEAVAADLKARRTDIETRFADSANPAHVYDALGELAARAGVRLERVEPGKGGRGVVSQCPEIMVSAVHTIEATGTMSQLANFFTAIDTELGMSHVGSVRLSPVPGSQGEQLIAMLDTTHLRLSEHSNKAAGKTGAKPGPRSGDKAHPSASKDMPNSKEDGR